MYRFRPQLQERIWGGDKIARFKSGVTATSQTIGESWELSGVDGHISVVDGGDEQGVNLNELIQRYKERLVGRKVYERFGCEFPILIKFIDAESDLSIQVHPDEELAQSEHGKHGKSEMWYVIEAEPESQLLAGFSRSTTKAEVAEAIDKGSILDLIKPHRVKAGDSFYLPAGSIHSIGGGVFLAEIQQTSDLTYRVYDYDRRDKDGNPRELHVASALKALDYSSDFDCRCSKESIEEGRSLLLNSPYFRVELLECKADIRVGLSHRDSFTALIITSGEVEITSHSESGVLCQRAVKGDTILVPAEVGHIELHPITERVEVIDCFIE